MKNSLLEPVRFVLVAVPTHSHRGIQTPNVDARDEGLGAPQFNETLHYAPPNAFVKSLGHVAQASAQLWVFTLSRDQIHALQSFRAAHFLSVAKLPPADGVFHDETQPLVGDDSPQFVES